jgi:Putative ABC exporter
MIADLAALCYLEFRQAINWIVSTARQPGRAIVYALLACYFIFTAVLRARTNAAMPIQRSPEPYASVLMFAFITLLGVVCYGAASGIAGTFSSPADARFLTGSRISERTIVIWLQLRRSGSAMLRMFLTLILYALVVPASGAVGKLGIAIIGGTVLTTATAIPMLKMRATIGARSAQSFAGVIAAIGILPMSILLSSTFTPSLIPAASLIERLGLGYSFNQLLHGNIVALSALYVAALLSVALACVVGTGLYPELYASSLRMLAFRERQRRGGGAAFSMEHVYASGKPHRLKFVLDRLSGPWTIAWKEWMAFLRSPSMQRIFLFGVFTCGVIGGVFGNLIVHSKDRLETTVSLATTSATMLVIFVAMGSAVALGADLRKPLWWMGPDPLWVRLFAWIVGTSWRLGVCLSVGVIAAAIALHSALVALVGIPIAIASVLYLRAVGLALYAMFPSSLDQRGPMAMVRALLTYAFAAPPMIVGSIIGGLLHTVEGAAVIGIAASIAETFALIAFAASRIAGRGVAVAQSELT